MLEAGPRDKGGGNSDDFGHDNLERTHPNLGKCYDGPHAGQTVGIPTQTYCVSYKTLTSSRTPIGLLWKRRLPDQLRLWAYSKVMANVYACKQQHHVMMTANISKQRLLLHARCSIEDARTPAKRKPESTGLLACWPAGLIGCWPAGLLGCWPTGLLACWPAGLLACWHADMLACWAGPGFTTFKLFNLSLSLSLSLSLFLSLYLYLYLYLCLYLCLSLSLYISLSLSIYIYIYIFIYIYIYICV